jgi:membrane protein YdbS with pleckstrin-like domain
MNSISKNSIIWVIVLLVEAIILQFAKSMRLWIYVALPIIAGFAAMELLKQKPIVRFTIPRSTVKKRVLK